MQGSPQSNPISGSYQGVTIQVPRQDATSGTPGAHPTGVATPPPGPVPQGQGSVPPAFPHYFSFGAMNPPGSASQLDDMRSRNGAAFSFRYQYLTGGVNTGNGWEHVDVAGLAQKEANFLNTAGLIGNPGGVSSWDVISNDVADFDSGQPGGRGWWDRYNHTFPNFARYLTFIGDLSQDTHRRIVMWQVPMGNQYFDTLNNSPGHYQDNRAEYILNNVASFATAGIIAVLFGPGNGGTINIDVMHDGVTNFGPVSTYECNMCNNHTSSYPDDDGGYLRIFVGQYLQHRVALS